MKAFFAICTLETDSRYTVCLLIWDNDWKMNCELHLQRYDVNVNCPDWLYKWKNTLLTQSTDMASQLWNIRHNDLWGFYDKHSPACGDTVLIHLYTANNYIEEPVKSWLPPAFSQLHKRNRTKILTPVSVSSQSFNMWFMEKKTNFLDISNR